MNIKKKTNDGNSKSILSNCNIREQTIVNFCNKLASKAPTPGGGSVAAMQGALGCSLIAMVADLTKGKQKYAEFEDINSSAFKKASKYKDKFLELADADIAAYSQMKGVLSLPRDTEVEKKLRFKKLQKTLIECAQPPIKTMRLAAESLELVEHIFGKSNAMAQSDLGCAATLLMSTIQNAWLNVLANTSYMNEQNCELKTALENEGQKILDEYKQKAERFYSACC